jgi:LPXTG-motif cell wall-anchored protein
VDPPVVVVDPPVVVVDPPVVVVDPPAVVAAAVVPPAVVPPAVVTPAATTPAPKAAAKAPAAAAAPVSQGTNQGFNAQTAVGGDAGNGAPTWLGGLGALLAAGLAVAARRRSRTE